MTDPAIADSALPSLPSRIDDALDRVGLLLDPTRRRVYAHVVSAPGATRDETARAVGIDRPLATFHLERLLEAGLVESQAKTEALGGRRPRGRPVKRYRAVDLAIELTFPARDYRLAAEVFADALAVTERPAALDDAARARGAAIGRAGRRTTSRPSGPGQVPPSLRAALDDEGYAPEAAADGRICLRNCPFDALAREHRDVICPTNRALLEGVLAGTQVNSYRAVLDPAPGRCCVVLEPISADSDAKPPRRAS